MTLLCAARGYTEVSKLWGGCAETVQDGRVS
jgi:hypothetical protein